MGKMPLIEQLRASAEAAKNFAASLFGSTTGALFEMEETKADKCTASSVAIPASGWKLADGQEGEAPSEAYPYYLDLSAENVTALDRATVTFSIVSLSEAARCGICQTCETANGRIRLWSAARPETDITAEYWIEQGASPSNEIPEEGKE